MFNDIINILYLLVASGTAGAIINLLSKHTKAHRLQSALTLAKSLVNSKATKYALDPHTPVPERKIAIARELQTELNRHGYTLQLSTLIELAQAALQSYKANGGKVEIPNLSVKNGDENK